MKNSILRRARIDASTRTAACWPILARGESKDSNAARLAAIEIRDTIEDGTLSCVDGWHVEVDDEAYRIACMLQS